MAQRHYVRSTTRLCARRPGMAARSLASRPPVRLGRGLAIALGISALFAVATFLLLVRSWVLDVPAQEADVMLVLGVGGLTWLTSLGYYALWQLDKQNALPTRSDPSQAPKD